jgi:hypothetical protein
VYALSIKNEFVMVFKPSPKQEEKKTTTGLVYETRTLASLDVMS